MFCRVKLNPPWENKKVFNKYKSAGASRTLIRYITVSLRGSDLFSFPIQEMVDLIDECTRSINYAPDS